VTHNITIHSFYEVANATLGKIGGKASEEVILQLVRTKCMPVLFFGLKHARCVRLTAAR